MKHEATTGPLRIAHLIESDGPGGAEMVVVRLASALQEGGMQNVAFLPEHGEGWLGRQLEGSEVAREPFRLEKPVSPACARSLAHAFRERGIMIAHSHEFSMAVYGAWASWLAGIPHVITMHGSDYYAKRLRRRVALRAAIAMSAQTVAVSALLARDLRRRLAVRSSRILVIPNGGRHQPPDRVTLRQELRLGEDERLLVAIGNLYPVKGHRYLLDALGMLSREYPKLHVAIAGRGDAAAGLMAQAERLGLSGRVHLLGLRADVSAILAAADIFVMPSLSEGLPIALLEAMFASRPIVASDVGEVSTALARGEAGVLVPPGDAEALAGALSRLLKDVVYAAELGRRAARRALEEYDESRMVSRYLEVYHCALQLPRTSSVDEPDAPRVEWTANGNA
jgi:glycosyltransferase involved in cell wall biosynthesis